MVISLNIFLSLRLTLTFFFLGLKQVCFNGLSKIYNEAGKTSITLNIEIIVPLEIVYPIEDINKSDEIIPISRAAITRIKPLEIIVGKASFKEIIIASFLSVSVLKD